MDKPSSLAPKSAAGVTLSSSVLIVRDSDKGIEVLMMTRAADLSFAGGAVVFPGGKVDADDYDTKAWRQVLGPHTSLNDTALRIAAVREVAEETGLLLGRYQDRSIISNRLATSISAKVHTSAASFRRALSYNDARLDIGALVPFAHWVTPEGLPKRFDTHFFIAKAPKAQRELLIEGEAVALAWERPLDILETATERGLNIWFPTRLNLMKLGQARSVAEAVAHARQYPPVKILPVIGKGPRTLPPELMREAGYPTLSQAEIAGFLGAGPKKQ